MSDYFCALEPQYLLQVSNRAKAKRRFLIASLYALFFVHAQHMAPG